jgi:hypothetical protein
MPGSFPNAGHCGKYIDKKFIFKNKTTIKQEQMHVSFFSSDGLGSGAEERAG